MNWFKLKSRITYITPSEINKFNVIVSIQVCSTFSIFRISHRAVFNHCGHITFWICSLSQQKFTSNKLIKFSSIRLRSREIGWIISKILVNVAIVIHFLTWWVIIGQRIKIFNTPRNFMVQHLNKKYLKFN